ncbi:D-alanyl-D-alanine carboxypeptidase family protein [Bacillus kwashiorkori]|uniref:D-alanyl-D-alanine carboxypeptidase family protein n=1 Tax=Bacillus kwashiorkori TaxID=1522318 RepID=UPI000B2456EE|nr:D-alanyl-D-alanine carboxypeptidase [Bacillus kwashiorkori]
MKHKKTLLMVITFIIFGIIFIFFQDYQKGMDKFVMTNPQKQNQSDAKTPFLHSEKAQQNIMGQNQLQFSKLYSKNAYLIRLSDGQVLLDQNSSELMYPASLTKIMTAIVAIEQLSDLETFVPLSEKMFHYLYEADAALAGFLPNEKVRALDLLYGILLPSGAEASVGIAEYIAGSEAQFVTLMNEKAKQLGLKHTHFTNVTGLHHDNHYSTTQDIATLLQYALKNDIFFHIFTSSRHSTKPTNMHADGITFYSTMFSKMDNPSFNNGELLGGKTGFTYSAGLCLASLAVIHDEQYILITTGAKGDSQTEPFHILDALTVYKELEKQLF